MKTILTAILILVSVQVAAAEPYVPTSTTTWTYDVTVPGLVGFKIYMEDTLLCSHTDLANLKAVCPAPGAVPGNNNIYISAYTDTYETNKSDPIIAFYLPPVEQGTTTFNGMLIIQ